MSHTEEPKKLHYFSASQISKALDCPRQWAFSYIEGRRSESTPSQSLGVLIHKILEEYLRDGKPLPYSDPDPEVAKAAEIAGSGIHFLPKPGTHGMQVEKSFVFESPGQIPLLYRGFKDIEIAGTEESPPQVWDHKTTTNLSWAKTEKVLRNDVQAVLYAYEAMVAHASKVVDLNWVYYQTRGPKRAIKVSLRMTSEQVVPLFLAFRGVLELLLRTLESGAHPLDLPGVATHCSAYGGCPFREECGPTLDPREKARAAMSNGPKNTEDLLALLHARNGEIAASPAITGVKPVAKSSPDLDDLLGPPKAKAAPAPAPEPPAINPPEFQPAPTAEERAEAAAVPAEKPKGRGRPAGSKNKPKEEPAPVVDPRQTVLTYDATLQEAAKAVVEIAEPQITAWMATSSEADPGFRLYVDCIPMGASVTYAEEIFAEVKKRILAEKGVADYRFIDFKGAGVFVATLETLVNEGYLHGTNVVLSSGTPEGSLAMSVLMPAALFPVVRRV